MFTLYTIHRPPPGMDRPWLVRRWGVDLAAYEPITPRTDCLAESLDDARAQIPAILNGMPRLKSSCSPTDAPTVVETWW